MALIVSQFFGIIIPDVPPPANMQELIPYLLTVFVGIFLVAAVYKVVSSVAVEIFTPRRF